jgi:hypothetical protein
MKRKRHETPYHRLDINLSFAHYQKAQHSQQTLLQLFPDGISACILIYISGCVLAPLQTRDAYCEISKEVDISSSNLTITLVSRNARMWKPGIHKNMCLYFRTLHQATSS